MSQLFVFPPGDVSVTIPGVATAANQTTEITKLTSIDGKITAVNTGAVVITSSALPSGAATEGTIAARLSGSLTPVVFDYIATTYVSGGVADGQINTVTYKTGGSSGTTVRTITMGYDGGTGKLISVTAS